MAIEGCRRQFVRQIVATVAVAVTLAAGAACGVTERSGHLPGASRSARSSPASSGGPQHTSRPPPVTVRRLLLGRSVMGRPIAVVELGNPTSRDRLLVVGCIHGNERAGIAVARELEELGVPRRLFIAVVADLNPDGVAADTRQNAHGVDLNRNFPWHWRPMGRPGYLFYSGPKPLSEPESRAAAALILRLHPEISMWFHQHADLVDLSGGNPAVERLYARLVGLPARQLPRFPGSAAGWENHRMQGTTAFVVELPAAELTDPQADRFAAAILRLT